MPAFLRPPAASEPDPLRSTRRWAAAGAISLALGIAAGTVLPLLTGTLVR